MDAETREVINAIETAWLQGRMIIPVIGSGFSADSGFPVVTSVVRYLAKFDAFLEKGAYLPKPAFLESGDKDLIHARRAEYKLNPLQFLQDYGWPDRFQLNEDLWNCFDLKRSGSKSIETLYEKHLRKLIIKLYPDNFATLKKKLEKTDKDKGEENIEGLATEDLWRILGDWKRLIQHMTGFDSNYADALFSRFGYERSPSLGHRYLAFLTKLLGLRMIFTFNFDSLIEQALTQERIAHTVFGMEQGSDLPHPFLLRQSIAVVKMHGNTHSLLLDERLDHPLSEIYKQRFDKCTIGPPLLLVLGCSGEDRRLRDLVEHVLSQPGADCVWLHFEKEQPSFHGNLKKEHSDSIKAVRVQNSGLFLSHLYSHLTSRHPASLMPYEALAQRPIGLETKSGEPENDELELKGESGKAYLFRHIKQPDNPDPASSASREMVALVNKHSITHNPIWIDLESHYTLGEVVGDIIGQCRRYDSALAPTVLPIDNLEQNSTGRTDKNTIDLAVRRVRQALSRTRYILAFDGYEAFCTAPTVHHGQTTATAEQAGDRLEPLKKFISQLVGKGNGEKEACTFSELRESILCLSIDHPKLRYSTDLKSQDGKLQTTVKQHAAEFETLFTQTPEIHPQPGSSPQKQTRIFEIKLKKKLLFPTEQLKHNSKTPWIQGTSNEPQYDELILFCLTCFRRTRTLVGLRRVLEPLICHNKQLCDQSNEILTRCWRSYVTTRFSFLLKVAATGLIAHFVTESIHSIRVSHLPGNS